MIGEEDVRRGRYNPFARQAQQQEITPGEQYRQARGTLYLTIAEMRKAYDLLGIRSLDSILENVLDLGLRQMVDHILAKKTEEPKEQ